MEVCHPEIQKDQQTSDSQKREQRADAGQVPSQTFKNFKYCINPNQYSRNFFVKNRILIRKFARLIFTSQGIIHGMSSSVTVFHGRDSSATSCAIAAIEGLGMKAVTFETARPGGIVYVHQVVERMLASDAFLIVLTGDDLTVLVEDLRGPGDENPVRFQPRPNVLFEMGLAAARNPDRAVFLRFGRVDIHSDIAGAHVETWISWQETMPRLRRIFSDFGFVLTDRLAPDGPQYSPPAQFDFDANERVFEDLSSIGRRLLLECVRMGANNIYQNALIEQVAERYNYSYRSTYDESQIFKWVLSSKGILGVESNGTWTINSKWNESIRRYLLKWEMI